MTKNLMDRHRSEIQGLLPVHEHESRHLEAGRGTWQDAEDRIYLLPVYVNTPRPFHIQSSREVAVFTRSAWPHAQGVWRGDSFGRDCLFMFLLTLTLTLTLDR